MDLIINPGRIQKRLIPLCKMLLVIYRMYLKKLGKKLEKRMEHSLEKHLIKLLIEIVEQIELGIQYYH